MYEVCVQESHTAATGIDNLLATEVFPIPLEQVQQGGYLQQRGGLSLSLVCDWKTGTQCALRSLC